MIRLMFVGQGRIPESIITLNFDQYLNPRPDHTFIYYGPDDAPSNLKDIYGDYDIDPKQITVINDAEMLWNQCPNTNVYKFGGHLAQQLIKLIALDVANDDQILIQDCDTFAIRPYTCFINDQPSTFVLENKTPRPTSIEYIRKFTGLSRQGTDCYVTEFMPVIKKDWTDLRTTIEARYNRNWLDAMIYQFEQDYPKETTASWFSEYEMLGNWNKFKYPEMPVTTQYRSAWLDKDVTINLQDRNVVCMPIMRLDLNQVRPIITKIAGLV